MVPLTELSVYGTRRIRGHTVNTADSLFARTLCRNAVLANERQNGFARMWRRPDELLSEYVQTFSVYSSPLRQRYTNRVQLANGTTVGNVNLCADYIVYSAVK